MNVVKVSKKMKHSRELAFIAQSLEAAIRLKDGFSVQVLTTRLLKMGYRLEVESESK